MRIQKQVGKMLFVTMAGALLCGPALAHGDKHDPVSGDGAAASAAGVNGSAAKLRLLDLELVDRHGRARRFKSDEIGDRIVVMDFIYTTCTTICPIQSAIMAQVQKGLKSRLGPEVRLISISVDPGTDTPQRLRKYARTHDAGPNWRWLTGYKPNVDRVLDALGVYTPDFTDHPPVMLVGDARTGAWTRLNGFPSPEQIIAKVEQLAAGRQQRRAARRTGTAPAGARAEDARTREDKAARYFTNLPVISQNGKTLRFYDDLLKDKIVLVSLFYTKCADACPLVNQQLGLLQPLLGKQLGKEVFFVSVTLDPENDTPAAIKDYAGRFKAGKGWTFVTGSKANIHTITRRLGQISSDIRAHPTYLIVGDVKRARWKKLRPNIPVEQIAAFLRSIELMPGPSPAG